jgi:ubiquinone/menaquinone biosynthesis C-methylase UbiE|tara:strand:- start:355 stop:1083 length:729 start_codon:yes stop_codon:yes gene_type:complete
LPENIFFKSIKNWDNKTWLSSSDYISFFVKFLIKQAELNKNSKIIDVGCGRGKILAHLFSKLKLRHKPLGIDLEKHKDRDKRINFKKVGAIDFFKHCNETFDLILIKQTIHLLKISEIKKLLNFCKNSLNRNGKIIIFILDSSQNEIPTFPLMNKELKISLKRDKRIIKFISKLYSSRIAKKFIYNVKISKKKYLEMIKSRYISTLLKFSSKEILQGTKEINLKHKKIIKFKDKLQCIIVKK